jgi:hypothetical protein
MPIDGDRRPGWGLLEVRSDGSVTVTDRRVEYDLPGWLERYTSIFERGEFPEKDDWHLSIISVYLY